MLDNQQKIEGLSKRGHQKTVGGDLGNEVLYRLCREHPNHTTVDEVNAKIWLIGRAYAAAIERRRIHLDIPNDEFYRTIVVPRMLERDVDEAFASLKSKTGDENILRVHAFLTQVFKELTNLEKRSLASKYLHFHFPDLYYIYDSRAVKELGVLEKEVGLQRHVWKKEHPDMDSYDLTYADFYYRAQRLAGILDLSPRQFDNLLLGYVASDIPRDK
jgi:hypothetical protein